MFFLSSAMRLSRSFSRSKLLPSCSYAALNIVALSTSEVLNAFNASFCSFIKERENSFKMASKLLIVCSNLSWLSFVAFKFLLKISPSFACSVKILTSISLKALENAPTAFNISEWIFTNSSCFSLDSFSIFKLALSSALL